MLIISRSLPRADVLVVLSGSAAYLERTQWAARLYMEGRAPRIVLTNDNQQGGWSNAEERNPSFVERAKAELQHAGVPPERIEVLPQTVASTYDEAVRLLEYTNTQPVRSLLVVTSAYHSRRALWTLSHVFRDTGVKIGLEPVALGAQSPAPATWWFDLRGWRAVALEYPKLIYYWISYS